MDDLNHSRMRCHHWRVSDSCHFSVLAHLHDSFEAHNISLIIDGVTNALAKGRYCKVLDGNWYTFRMQLTHIHNVLIKQTNHQRNFCTKFNDSKDTVFYYVPIFVEIQLKEQLIFDVILGAMMKFALIFYCWN